MNVDERTLVADVKSYIDTLDGFRAEVEEHAEKVKRMDLTIYHGKKLICIAEFKRPTTIEGATPRNVDVVKDAYFKSSSKSPPPRFFVTSNFNETIVWDNYDTSKPVMARDIYTVYLEKKIKKDEDFNVDEVKEDIQEKMQELTIYINDLAEGVKKAYYKPLGESFILGLNAHLGSAAAVVKKHVPNNILQKWWRDQSYMPKISFDEYDREKIAKYSLYVLANKIVFYYVLRRMFPTIIEISGKKETIATLKEELDFCFDMARNVSGDYKTVFEESEADLIPFGNDENIDSVRALVRFLEEYDFTKLSQDILGNIYDKLISPEERHANGQYYTPISVVDLINALTIKKADARVMDPACGSGTFLARAFDLKLKLYGNDNEATKEAVTVDLFGCDIAPYPAHLATVALASKLLMYNPNAYPNILKKDFLKLEISNVIPTLRTELVEEIENETKSLSGVSKKVTFKPIDAFVGNLPYIRQEEIQNKEEERERVKKFLKENGFSNRIKDDEEYLFMPDNSADFHIYFWYYLMPFLKEGSRVGFLTSDTWMNVEYGHGFKKFLNRYFKIKYIIDSSVERWFEDALVNTSITILERTDSEKDRQNNKIKFMRITKKISDIVSTIDDAIGIAENIEKGKEMEGIINVREIEQGSLDFDDVMKSKLFPYLRGPHEFFEITENKNMMPLEKIMNVQFGIKTGANKFFYVTDVTDKYNDEQLKNLFGILKGGKNKTRVIRDGEKVEHLMEREYLFPIIKGPKEFTVPGKLIFNYKTKKSVFLVTENDNANLKKYASKYIEYGEKNPHGEPYSERKTCRSHKPWWKLSPVVIPDMAFPAQLEETFIFPKVSNYLDAKLYLMNLREDYKSDLISVYSFLNSSLSYLYPDLLGRNYGGGSTDFKVYETQQLPIPKPEAMKQYYQELKVIMDRMENRKVGSVFEEIWNMNGEFSLRFVQEDRLELDRTILKALGFKNPDKFLMLYYPSVVRLVRERLDRAKSIKPTNKKDKASLSKVADEIIEKLNVKEFPQNYLTKSISTITIVKGANISHGMDLIGPYVSIDGIKEYYDSKEIARYVFYCAKRGIESVPVPEELKSTLKEFEKDLKAWKKLIEKEIDCITDDNKYKEKLLSLCAKKLNYSMLEGASE